jgi:VWFA-related protein
VIGSPEDCPAISYYQADRILNLNDQEAQFAAEVSYVMKCSPPGPRRSDVEAALQEAHQVVKALAPRALELGARATEANLGILRDLIRRMAVLPGTRSILLVSPGFFLRDDSHDTAADVMDRAVRANVVISSLSTQGVSAITPGGNADTPPGLPIEVKQEFDRKAGYADEGIMQDLADGTGGTLFHNSNDFSGGLRRSAAQPEFIYVLGFSPQISGSTAVSMR